MKQKLPKLDAPEADDWPDCAGGLGGAGKLCPAADRPAARIARPSRGTRARIDLLVENNEGIKDIKEV